MVHGVWNPQYQGYGKKILVGTHLKIDDAIAIRALCGEASRCEPAVSLSSSVFVSTPPCWRLDSPLPCLLIAQPSLPAGL